MALFTETGNADAPTKALASQFGCDAGTVDRAKAKWRKQQEAGELRVLALCDLRMDAGTQMRPGLVESRVKELAELDSEGIDLDPIEVWDTPAGHVVSDGFHRTAAFASNGKGHIRAVVRTGTLRDALLAAIGANARGPMPRDSATKEKAVRTLLDDPEWGSRPTRELARLAGVSYAFAKKVHEAAHAATHPAEPLVTVGVNGRSYEHKPAGNGKARASVESEPDAYEAAERAAIAAEAKQADAIAEAGVKRMEWLRTLTVRDRLAENCRKHFDADALSYLDTIGENGAFKTWHNSVLRFIGEKRTGHKPPFERKLSSFFRTPHPRDWKMCIECHGTGQVAGIGECRHCKGDGYVIV